MSEPARSESGAALRQVFPVLLAVMPFGIVYGAIAVGSGLTVLQALGFSVLVYAGASQLAALQLLGLGAPLWSVLLTVFALNFRHVLYSASIGRHLGRFSPLQKAAAFSVLVDPTFGAAEVRASDQPLTKRYYFTYGLILYVGWQLASLIGAAFGSLIEDPKAFGLDFVLPVYFLALVMTFRRRGQFYPVALTSLFVSMLVYLTVGPPWHVSVGGLAGIAVAALTSPATESVEGAGRG
ncbi:AzlC family ABC transporter permease [Aurantimonas sp. VKM B-3413]|uniref:AzlC family ABC transporter permease n=1 Tax=Aurantimonas sp. VKM B-3413 TaxID=2779401 RepID=UPI001E53B1E1|nr:AzlC family ABC transporter permease [Aurantimonas sp. VKM B-3413]MCB8837888.1 AzlC family ABC transporter permease [Aurantimonas sp. VKM B-3413]